MTCKIGETKRRMQNYRPDNRRKLWKSALPKGLPLPLSYDLLRRLTEKGVISKERFAKLCSLLRQYNQGIIWKRATMPARSQKELKNTYYTLLYAAGDVR